MAASELFRAARQLLSDCEDRCESVQFITLPDNTDRRAIFASLPDCVKRACGGGYAAGQIGAIWPARCCADSFRFLFGVELPRTTELAYHLATHDDPTPSPLARHSALVLLQLMGAGSEQEMDRLMQINEHDSDELVFRKIACAAILASKSLLKMHRGFAAHCVVASFKEIDAAAGAVGMKDESSGRADNASSKTVSCRPWPDIDQVTREMACARITDEFSGISIFRNKATGQRAVLCVGCPCQQTIRVGDETFPVIGLDPNPYSAERFASQYQWPYDCPDVVLAATVRQFAKRLIEFNPLVSSVALGREWGSDRLFIGIGYVSQDWKPDSDKEPPETPDGLEVRCFLNVVSFTTVRLSGTLPSHPADVTRAVGAIIDAPIAAPDDDTWSTGGIVARDADNRPVLVTVGHGFRDIADNTPVQQCPAYYRTWVQRDTFISTNPGAHFTIQKRAIRDAVTSIESLKDRWMDLAWRYLRDKRDDLNAVVHAWYTAPPHPEPKHPLPIGQLLSVKLPITFKHKDHDYTLEYATIRLDAALPEESTGPQATKIWKTCADPGFKERRFTARGATSGEYDNLENVPGDTVTNPIHFGQPIREKPYTGLLIFQRDAKLPGLVGGDSGACFYYQDGADTVAVAILGQSDSQGFMYAYPLDPIFSDARLSL